MCAFERYRHMSPGQVKAKAEKILDEAQKEGILQTEFKVIMSNEAKEPQAEIEQCLEIIDLYNTWKETNPSAASSGMLKRQNDNQDLYANIQARLQLLREIELNGDKLEGSKSHEIKALNMFSQFANNKFPREQLRDAINNFDHDIMTENPALGVRLSEAKHKIDNKLTKDGEKLLKAIEDRIRIVDKQKSDKNQDKKLAVLRASRQYLIGTKDEAYLESVKDANKGYNSKISYSEEKRLSDRVKTFKKEASAVKSKTKEPKIEKIRKKLGF